MPREGRDVVGVHNRQHREEDEEEDNTLSLAQMEETLKPMALEKFATITEIFRAFSKAQESRMVAMANGESLSQKAEDSYHELREQLTEALSNAILRGNREDPAKSVRVRAELTAERLVAVAEKVVAKGKVG